MGILTNLQMKRAQKTGKRYALAELEDMDSSVEVIFFEKVLSKHETLVISGAPIMVTGTIEAESDTLMKIIVTGVKSLKEVRQESISALHIRLDAIGVDDDMLKTMEAIFIRHKGDCPIFFHVNAKEGEKVIRAHRPSTSSPRTAW